MATIAEPPLPPPEPAAVVARSRRARWAGIVVGLVVVVALVVTGALRWDTPAEDASEDLVAAWARHRTGTFVVEGEWSRTTTADGRTLASATLLAQRPPDRIVRQLGAVRGRLGDAVVRCNTDAFDRYTCTPAEGDLDGYQAEVDEEVAGLRSWFREERPLYTVTRDDRGCFVLEQAYPLPDPPYGVRAVLCFDEATGALRYLERDFGDLTEVQEATAIRTQVTDADFDVTRQETFDPRFDLAPVPDGEDDPSTDPDADAAPGAGSGG